MSNITMIIGDRLRNYRTKQDLSQEKVAERAGLHTTYIGQLERGEKNATLESIEKVTKSLNISLKTLFEKIGDEDSETSNAQTAYELVLKLSEEKQLEVIEIIKRIIEFKE